MCLGLRAAHLAKTCSAYRVTMLAKKASPAFKSFAGALFVWADEHHGDVGGQTKFVIFGIFDECAHRPTTRLHTTISRWMIFANWFFACWSRRNTETCLLLWIFQQHQCWVCPVMRPHRFIRQHFYFSFLLRWFNKSGTSCEHSNACSMRIATSFWVNFLTKCLQNSCKVI